MKAFNLEKRNEAFWDFENNLTRDELVFFVIQFIKESPDGWELVTDSYKFRDFLRAKFYDSLEPDDKERD